MAPVGKEYNSLLGADKECKGTRAPDRKILQKRTRSSAPHTNDIHFNDAQDRNEAFIAEGYHEEVPLARTLKATLPNVECEMTRSNENEAADILTSTASNRGEEYPSLSLWDP